MNNPPVLHTLGRFTLRFALLILITAIVLASVSVSESRAPTAPSDAEAVTPAGAAPDRSSETQAGR